MLVAVPWFLMDIATYGVGLFPTQLRGTASGFAAGVAKIGATLGVFVLPILKGRFGVPAVLGMMATVSVLGLVVTLAFGREDSE